MRFGMAERGRPGLRVLHVTATNQRRGAEVFAADLIAATTDGATEHHLAYLRSAGEGAALVYPCPSQSLRAPAGAAGVPVAAGALRLLANKVRPDVVQAHGGEPLRAAVLADLGDDRPLVYRRIGSAPASMLGGWRRQWHRWLMGRAAAVVCVAEAVRVETIERLGLDPAQVSTIPNAVDPARVVAADPAAERAGLRAELAIPAGAAVVLSLGALSWEKDPLGALDVTAPLLRGGAGIRHLFAGDGPLRAPLLARAVELGVAGQVVAPGSRGDVARVLAAADVVLFASRAGGMEGMPATVIEAGLAGRAVVAADVAGVGEVVEHGVTGALVRAGDQHGLRAALAGLLADPARRAALGAAGARRGAAHFTIAAVAPRYREVWEAVRARTRP